MEQHVFEPSKYEAAKCKGLSSLSFFCASSLFLVVRSKSSRTLAFRAIIPKPKASSRSLSFGPSNVFAICGTAIGRSSVLMSLKSFLARLSRSLS